MKEGYTQSWLQAKCSLAGPHIDGTAHFGLTHAHALMSPTAYQVATKERRFLRRILKAVHVVMSERRSWQTCCVAGTCLPFEFLPMAGFDREEVESGHWGLACGEFSWCILHLVGAFTTPSCSSSSCH